MTGGPFKHFPCLGALSCSSLDREVACISGSPVPASIISTLPPGSLQSSVVRQPDLVPRIATLGKSHALQPGILPLGQAQVECLEWRVVLLAIDLKRPCLWSRHPSCPLITECFCLLSLYLNMSLSLSSSVLLLDKGHCLPSSG
jgi:hypothetical protein